MMIESDSLLAHIKSSDRLKAVADALLLKIAMRRAESIRFEGSFP